MLYAARDPPAWQSVGTDRRADVEGFARIWKRRARAAVIRVDYESDVSEATGADIEHLGLEHGHWALTVAHDPGNQPGHRRTHQRAAIAGQRRPAAGPALFRRRGSGSLLRSHRSWRYDISIPLGCLVG